MISFHFRLIPSSSACNFLVSPFAGSPLGLLPSVSSLAQPVSFRTLSLSTPKKGYTKVPRLAQPLLWDPPSCMGEQIQHNRLPCVLTDGLRASEMGSLVHAAQTSLLPPNEPAKCNASSVIYRDYSWLIKFFFFYIKRLQGFVLG